MNIVLLSPRNDLTGNRKLLTLFARELGAKHVVRMLYPLIPDRLLLRNSIRPVSWLGYGRKIAADLLRYVAHPRWMFTSLLPSARVSIRPYWSALTAQDLADADVVLYCSPYQALELAEIPKGRAVRIFYAMHDQSRTDGHVIAVERILAAYRTGDHRIALSEETRGHLAERGVSCEAVIPAGVDIEVFYPAPKPHEGPPKLLGYYWPGEPRKGADVLWEALQQIRARHPEVRVSLLTPPGVRVPGVRTFSSLSEEELAQLYRAHDIFIYPNTHGGGFGLPPLEAMASGCGVVATTVGAIGDYARHEDSALLCTPGDAGQLVKSVQRLVQQPQLLAAIRIRAVQEARRWSWQHAAERLERYLAGLVCQSAGSVSLAEEVVQYSGHAEKGA